MSAEVPSLTEIVSIVVLLVPGFVAFTIIRHLAIAEKEFRDFEVVVWSLFGSLLIYIPFSLLVEIDSLEDIRDNIFKPEAFGSIVALSLGSGFGLGFLMRWRLGIGRMPNNMWDMVWGRINPLNPPLISVYTPNDIEYQGLLLSVTQSRIGREVVIRQPNQVLRDPQGNITNLVNLGASMYFKEQQIGRIVFH